jgi:hypothetical protein
MATSGDLIEIVAHALGLNPETVGVHVRNLRAASLINRRGVGKSAARMTSLDAARVLLAAAGSPLVKDSVETVREYGALLSHQGFEPPSRGLEAGQFNLESNLAVELDRLAAENTPLSKWDFEGAPERSFPEGKAAARTGLQLFATVEHGHPPFRAAALQSAARGVGRVTCFAPDYDLACVETEAEFRLGTLWAGLSQVRAIGSRALENVARRLG